jgi:hypothetical protein
MCVITSVSFVLVQLLIEMPGIRAAKGVQEVALSPSL